LKPSALGAEKQAGKVRKLVLPERDLKHTGFIPLCICFKARKLVLPERELKERLRLGILEMIARKKALTVSNASFMYEVMLTSNRYFSEAIETALFRR
jgi:hypothetical protein